ncbi:hypothetical protein EIP75_03720 [Aquabacterium soli]|uniref:Uncharacterized protein n=1 Tax=Aquabacterium soli TaxID=2493092 RepID=A0A426VGC2_9BURK|nr:hypothetical protein [Aquabacterium soli]RRS05973.1 hypothetical protein EIP75_03720 [Aquabacterium soli]
MPDPKDKSSKVTIGEWFLLAISVFFTVLPLLFIRTDFRESMVMLAMFGSALLINIHIIRRKFRLKKLARISVKAVGGVPIRPSRTRLAQMSVGLLVVGTIFVLCGKQNDMVFRAIAWLIVGMGAILLVALLTGLLPAEFIQFEPEGFALGRRSGKALVPWDAIRHMSAGEVHGNQAVFLWFNQEAVTATPETYLPKVHKAMASSRDWLGADFVVMSSVYNIDAPVLLATLERYVNQPDCRAELEGQIKLAGRRPSA